MVLFMTKFYTCVETLSKKKKKKNKKKKRIKKKTNMQNIQNRISTLI